MNYEQAKEKALKINLSINSCKEYKIAYYFYDKNDSTERTPDNDVVIIKETGKTSNFSNFILKQLPKETPKDRIF